MNITINTRREVVNYLYDKYQSQKLIVEIIGDASFSCEDDEVGETYHYCINVYARDGNSRYHVDELVLETIDINEVVYRELFGRMPFDYGHRSGDISGDLFMSKAVSRVEKIETLLC